MVKQCIVIAGFLLALFAGESFAKLGPYEQQKIDRLSITLSLTAAQKTKLTIEREKSAKKLNEFEQEWQRQHDLLRREVRKEKPDQAIIQKISGDIGKVQGNIVALRTNSLLYLKSILTPSQITKLEQNQAAE